MRILRVMTGIAFLVVTGLSPAWAQQPLPEQRFIYTQDADFYGADLGPLFDTSRAACARACTAQASCVAFTFNTRSNACFPKSAVTQSEYFEGALSARKVVTAPTAQQTATVRLNALSVISEADVSAARKLVQENADRNVVGEVALSDILVALDAATARGDVVAAARWVGRAVALTDQGDMWARMAWLGMRPRGDTARDLARRLQRDAVPAAINAYLRAETPAQQVTSLDLLARALEKNRRGRDMVGVLRLAVDLEPRDALQTALDTAIGKYGFRVTGTRVDNNSAQPRICAEFSEKLVEGGIDYEPFVRLIDTSLVPDAEGQSICIDGVAHGSRYTVTFRAGLPAASGEVLHKDYPVTLYVRDREPLVRFSGRAYVLPRSAQAAIPVETVNTDMVTLRLRRVSDRNLLRAIQDSYFGKPLSKYQEDEFARTIAQDVWTGTGEVQNTLNAQVTTRLPLTEALKEQPAGIYALTAGINGADPYQNPSATQWFILTDLGLGTMVGTDGLHATVRSLEDASARKNVKLSLISRANEVLAQTMTDANGSAHFAAGFTRGSGAASPALLMAEGPAGDTAFLSLTEPAFDLSDRGVEGRPPSGAIDTFMTTDRGAYRVGETVYATVLARDAQGGGISDLPLVAVLKRPDGAEYSRNLNDNSNAGGYVFALPIGEQAPRGAWRLDVIADPAMAPIASQTFLVEDFLPDRIELKASLPTNSIALGSTPSLRVDGRYLFGAPAADLVVEGEARLRTKRNLEAHRGFLFGRYDQRFDTRTTYLNAATTDAQGKASLVVQLPDVNEIPSQPLELSIVARMTEGSGRPVEERLVRGIDPQGPMIGVRPGFDDVLTEGADALFDVIVTEGEMPVRWTLNKIETRYQWYQNGGNWAWEPITRRVRAANGTLDLTLQPTSLTMPTQWGQYELVVEELVAPYATTSVSFSSGWYGGDDASATPDYLAVSLDSDTYDLGAVANLRVVAPYAGVALVSVLSNRVIEQVSVTVEEGETVIPLTVTPDWGSSAYVSATFIRPMDADAGLNPSRSLGLAHATVRPDGKQLRVSIDAAKEIVGQAGVLRVPVQVDGLTDGEVGFVTLAAVDVGILNLTDFQPPDPSDHYFGQRRLGVEIRDVYGRLIDGLNGTMGRVRSGGDAVAAAQLRSPPPTEELMAFFSGPIRTDAEGRAVIEVSRPAFNGTIRLMAVAWSKTAVGNAVQDVTASDPVILTASLPRLLAPKDTSRLLLEMIHTRGPAGLMKLDVFADAGIAMGAVPEQINVTENGTVRLPLDLSAREIGDHKITVQLTTSDGSVLRRVLSLPVRINDPVVANTRRFSLGAGETFTFDDNVLAGLRGGTATATITAGPLARLNVSGLLHELDVYPYGCTEQVISGALPLLYLSEVAMSAGLGAPSDIDAKISNAIDRVLARQASNGAFGLWRASSGDFWLDAYVSDFLWSAKAQGHNVPPRALASALDNLRNRVNFAPEFDSGGEDIAYALLVLARAGAAQMGDLRYYADTKAAAFSTPMAAAQLGAALAAYGDLQRAETMFSRAGALLLKSPERTAWRDDFGSGLRDRAAVVRLAAQSKSQALNLDALAQSLQPADRGLSTQEAAQVVLAAHALETIPREGLEVDGQSVSGTFARTLSDRDPQISSIRNTAATPTDITLTTFGVPEIAPDAGGYGYAVNRRYFDMKGNLVTGPVASGTRLVAVLTVQPFEKFGARLMIDDPLPGGLEIDNPNLLSSASIKGLDWLQTVTPQNVEFRADRFLAAVDRKTADAFQLAYVVRAVTPGDYHHPAAQVSDMYRPEYSAHTSVSRLIVTP